MPEEYQSPWFIQKMDEIYKEKMAHAFSIVTSLHELHVERLTIGDCIARAWDSQVQKDLRLPSPEDTKSTTKPPVTPSLVMFYSRAGGLEFAHPKSREIWEGFMRDYYSGRTGGYWVEDWESSEKGFVLERFLQASKERVRSNRAALMANKELSQLALEVRSTIVFVDAEYLFHPGSLDWLSYVRRWARDEQIGDRNRIILLTEDPSGMTRTTLRPPFYVLGIEPPSRAQRTAWLEDFAAKLAERTKRKPMIVFGNSVSGINFAEDFSMAALVDSTDGLSNRDIENMITHSWISATPLSLGSVNEYRKQLQARADARFAMEKWAPTLP